MEILIPLIIIALVGYLIYWRTKNLKNKKEEYDQALRGRDKKAALDAGRIYYQALRGGKLTIYDEQAIANDINTMN